MAAQLLTEELNSLNQKIEQAHNAFISLLGAKREVEKLLDMLLKGNGEASEENSDKAQSRQSDSDCAQV